MAVLKCKMCGGDLEVTPGQSVAECEYCGSRQTVPTVDDEKKLTLFARTNRLRIACEFDKAAGVYETIVADFPQEAESYWGLVLCKYGIEYVDDPGTGKKIPTCHRSSFQSILEDSDYEQALENADVVARKVYREEARQIEELRKGIIAVSSREAPYDIFICYKETDPSGNRTLDSVLAQDIYDALTEKGYRVFFSRITLEDKLGQEYEPYIFAALNSARIMLAVGTDYEYYNAVWVKNEWSRFLKLMTVDKAKHLIPCYKGIDAYDMPKEFNKLQAQDLGKLGAMQDLLRGIGKLLPKQKQEPIQENVQKAAASTTAPLLKRMFLFLESGKWAEADSYAERVLDQDPECGEAYLGKLLAEKKLSRKEDLAKAVTPMEKEENYKNALRFADPKLKSFLESCSKKIKDNIETEKKEEAYKMAVGVMKANENPKPLMMAADEFERLGDFRDARQMREKCLKKIEDLRKADIYSKACADVGRMRDTRNSPEDRIRSAEKAAAILETILDFHNAKSMYDDCHNIIAQINAQVQAEKEAAEARELAEKETALSNARQNMAENTFTSMYRARGLLETIPGFRDADELLVQCIAWFQEDEYNKKLKLAKESEDLDDLNALALWFTEQGDYRDCKALAKHCKDRVADLECQALEAEKARITENIRQQEHAKQEAARIKKKRIVIGSAVAAVLVIAILIVTTVSNMQYQKAFDEAVALYESGKYEQAAEQFRQLEKPEAQEYYRNCLDSIEYQNKMPLYEDAKALMESDNYEAAAEAFAELGDFQDSPEMAQRAYYGSAEVLLAEGRAAAAAMRFCMAGNYRDASARAAEIRTVLRNSTIAAGGHHNLGLRQDGTVVANGLNEHGQLNVSDWTDIVAVSAGFHYSVGLKSDGTVVASGSNEHNQCDVQQWRNIVAVSACCGNGLEHTLGLKADGCVVAVGNNAYGQCDVSGWTDIVDIAAGENYSLGLRANGNVVSVGERRAPGWNNIVAISAGSTHMVGLCADGTVVASGDNEYGQCDVSEWTDIVAISAGSQHTVGLRADGTVVAAGNNRSGQCGVSGWSDIAAISTNHMHTIGVKLDGTVVAVGLDMHRQCNVSDFSEIQLNVE